MDCGTCDSASIVVVVEKPQIISVNLTITDNASSMLNTLSLDVDDDIFLFMFIKNDSSRIWEMYKLAPEKNIIIRDFGSWTREIGLKFTNLKKWQRRGDLTVSILILMLKVRRLK